MTLFDKRAIGSLINTQLKLGESTTPQRGRNISLTPRFSGVYAPATVRTVSTVSR